MAPLHNDRTTPSGSDIREELFVSPNNEFLTRMFAMVLFFETLLVLASLLITWFAVYVLYRLVTDES